MFCSEAVEFELVKLEISRTVILSPAVSVLRLGPRYYRVLRQRHSAANIATFVVERYTIRLKAFLPPGSNVQKTFSIKDGLKGEKSFFDSHAIAKDKKMTVLLLFLRSRISEARFVSLSPCRQCDQILQNFANLEQL